MSRLKVRIVHWPAANLHALKRASIGRPSVMLLVSSVLLVFYFLAGSTIGTPVRTWRVSRKVSRRVSRKVSRRVSRKVSRRVLRSPQKTLPSPAKTQMRLPQLWQGSNESPQRLQQGSNESPVTPACFNERAMTPACFNNKEKLRKPSKSGVPSPIWWEKKTASFGHWHGSLSVLYTVKERELIWKHR